MIPRHSPRRDQYSTAYLPHLLYLTLQSRIRKATLEQNCKPPPTYPLLGLDLFLHILKAATAPAYTSTSTLHNLSESPQLF